MNRSDVDWQGYWVAAPTPFVGPAGNGGLDEVGWAALVELYIAQGVHGLLVNGSTGEWFSQMPDERRRVVEVAVEAAAGRVPVLAGVSAFTSAEACALAVHAESAGAAGVLATPPPYVHPSPEEVVAFFAEVSSASDLPFMIYNWPRGVSLDLAVVPGLMAQLAQLDQVVAIKDSTGDWRNMLATVEAVADSVRVFGSFLHRPGLAVLLGMGGDGNIDGGGLGAPYAVPFYEAVRIGDGDSAAKYVDAYQSVSGRLINSDYSGVLASPVSQLKAAMAMLDQPAGEPRPPLLPLTDPSALATLRTVLIEGGVLT